MRERFRDSLRLLNNWLRLPRLPKSTGCCSLFPGRRREHEKAEPETELSQRFAALSRPNERECLPTHEKRQRRKQPATLPRNLNVRATAPSLCESDDGAQRYSNGEADFLPRQTGVSQTRNDEKIRNQRQKRQQRKHIFKPTGVRSRRAESGRGCGRCFLFLHAVIHWLDFLRGARFAPTAGKGCVV